MYFANEDVKEKFLEASKCGLGKINSYNENGKLFTYTTNEGQDTYYFYEFPLAKENDLSPSSPTFGVHYKCKISKRRSYS